MISTLSSRPRTLIAALAVAGVLVVSACGSDDDPGTADANTDSTTADAGTAGTTAGTGDASAGADALDGRAFESTELTGHELVDGSVVTIAFGDGRLSANAGCNTMMGAFSLDGDTLVTGDLAMTMMACEPALMDQDTWLSAFLGSSPTLTVDGETLTLTGDEATLTLAEIADAPIEGTAWTVTGIIDGDAISSVPEGASFTISDGAIALNSGCNTGTGDVEVGESTLTFGAIASTLKACADEAINQLETTIHSVLDGEVDFEIDGTTLVITGPSGVGLQLTAS